MTLVAAPADFTMGDLMEPDPFDGEPLRALADAVPLGLFVKDRDLRYLYANPAYCRQLGLPSPETLLGRSDDELFYEDFAAYLRRADRTILDSSTPELRRVEPAPDGSCRWTSRVDLTRAGGRAALGGVSETALPGNEVGALVRHALGHGRFLIWTATVVEWDASLNSGASLFWSLDFLEPDACRNWLPIAWTDAEPFGIAFAAARLQEDTERCDQTCRQALGSGASSYQQEFRIRLEDGSVRWLSENVQIQVLAPGRWQMVGVCTDTTALKVNQTHLQRLIQSSGCVLWQADVYRRPIGDDPADAQLAREQGTAEQGYFYDWPRGSVLVEGSARFDHGQRVGSRHEKDFWPGRSQWDRVTAARRSSVALEQGQPGFVLEFACTDRTGAIVWIHEEVHLEQVAQDRWQAVGICTDITGLKANEARLRQMMSGARCLIWYATVFRRPIHPEQPWTLEQAINQGTIDTGIYYDWFDIAVPDDEAAQRWLPISRQRDSSYAIDLYQARYVADQAATDRRAGQALLNGEAGYAQEYRTRLHDGSLRWLSEDVHIQQVAEGHYLLVGVCTDIDERKRSEERNAYEARHDSLTGLLNRLALQELLEASAPAAERSALLFLDLDNFKVINDSLGHGFGDSVLVAVAQRLRAALEDFGTIARLGGDEFTVWLPDANRRAAKAIARDVSALLTEPLEILGQTINLTVSVGIAMDAGKGAADLLRRADMAMYEAKGAGKNRAIAFHPSMDRRARERFELESSLRQALEAGDLALHFQPIVDLETGALHYLEALVRWRRGDGSSILPSRFIPLAEETGLIVPIGLFVLEEACRQAVAWRRLCPNLVIGVNVSGVQLASPGFVERVRIALRDTGLPPEALLLEITETVAMSGDAATAVLERLRDRGIRLSIDDFGTGYSSMNCLSRMPIQGLKIDRSFVRHLAAEDPTQSRNNAAIVRMVVALGATLGISVTAEGIESEAQRQSLLAHGVTSGQGFFLASPLSVAEAESWLADRAVRLAA